MNINIQHDLDRLTRGLSDLEKRQIPFAANMAINNTVKGIRDYEIMQMPVDLDRPTPFTMRGVKYKRSTKATLEGIVYLDDIQNEYLKYQIDGGTRLPKGRSIPVPASRARKNSYGNLPKGRINQLMRSRRKYFSGKPDGSAAGIWERVGDKIKPVVFWVKKATYNRGRFKFYYHGERYIGHYFNRHLSDALNFALRTARR